MSGVDVVRRLEAARQTSAPFWHVVVDDFIDGDSAMACARHLAAQPWMGYRDQLCLATRSFTPEGDVAGLRDLRSAALRASVSEFTGRHLEGLLMFPWRFQLGHYLLPHTDRDQHAERAIAFVLHLPCPTPGPPLQGGDLLLYQRNEHGWRVGETISHQPGRLVLFEVGPETLHRVTEITGGERWTVSGWFTSQRQPAVATSPRPRALPRHAKSDFFSPQERASVIDSAADAWRRVDDLERGRRWQAPAPRDALQRLRLWLLDEGFELDQLQGRLVRYEIGDYDLHTGTAAMTGSHRRVEVVVDLGETQPTTTCLWSEGGFTLSTGPVDAGEAVAVAVDRTTCRWQPLVSQRDQGSRTSLIAWFS